MKYNPRFGIEYTFMLPSKTGKPIECQSIRGDIAYRLNKKGFPRAYTDPGVVEVPSPPHASLDEAKKFFDRLGKAAGLEGLVPRIVTIDRRGNEVHYCNGGGDVHVELPPSNQARADLVEQLIPIMCNRPWINWVFNQFGDSENANSLLNRSDVRAGLFEGDLRDYGEASNKYSNLMGLIDSNKYIIRANNDNQTIEFRMFDAVCSWEQTRNHVEFCIALMRYAKSRVGAGLKPEKVKRFKELKNLSPYGDIIFDKTYKTLKSVRVPYKKLIKTLGLDWDRYSKYMKNFKDRLAFGELT